MFVFATFESKYFKPFLPESCQANEGVYGAELAWFLSKELAEHKIYTSYPEFEDYTWFLTHETNGHELEIHCQNKFRTPLQWEIKLKFFRTGMLKNKKSNPNDFPKLVESLKKVLTESSSISDLTIYSSC